MFGLGMPEILMILAIALIVIGPKKLPDLAKTLGRAMGEFKRSAQDFKNSIDIETTVNDLSDIETPEPSLRDAIKETESKESPYEEYKSKNEKAPPENNETSVNENSEPSQKPEDDTTDNK